MEAGSIGEARSGVNAVRAARDWPVFAGHQSRRTCCSCRVRFRWTRQPARWSTGIFAAQTHRVFQNLRAILEAAGASFDNVVRTTVYLADMNDFPAMNEVYATYFRSPAPARATVQAARLPKDARIEIDLIASL